LTPPAPPSGPPPAPPVGGPGPPRNPGAPWKSRTGGSGAQGPPSSKERKTLPAGIVKLPPASDWVFTSRRLRHSPCAPRHALPRLRRLSPSRPRLQRLPSIPPPSPPFPTRPPPHPLPDSGPGPPWSPPPRPGAARGNVSHVVKCPAIIGQNPLNPLRASGSQLSPPTSKRSLQPPPWITLCKSFAFSCSPPNRQQKDTCLITKRNVGPQYVSHRGKQII